MSKTISAGLKTHTAQEVTTLTTCWKLDRGDGVVLGFTSHDTDIPYDGVVYEAQAGFVPTDIVVASGLNVDNLDVFTFLVTEQVLEIDLMSGKYADSRVDIFQINYKNLTDGPMYYAKGWLIGEITIEDHIVTMELRGKAQKLQQNFIDLYGPMCRARFGDEKCGIDVTENYTDQGYISEVLSRQAFRLEGIAAQTEDVYAYGTAIITGVSSLASAIIIHDLTNPNFETGDLTGWTAVSGTMAVTADTGGYGPQSGVYYLVPTGGDDCKIKQEVDLVADGVSTTAIDNGDFNFVADIYLAADNGDEGQLQFIFKNASKVEISTASSGLASKDLGTYGLLQHSAAMPPNTRYVDVVLNLANTGGGGYSIAFDNLHHVGTAYKSGTFGGVPLTVPLTNHSFETGDLTGWSYDTGGSIGAPAVDDIRTWTQRGAYDGDYFIKGSGLVGYKVFQEIDLVNTMSLSAVSIDAGVYGIKMTARQAGSIVNPRPGGLLFRFKDAGHTVQSELYNDYTEAFNEWAYTDLDTPIPAGTRYIDVCCYGTDGGLGGSEVYHDFVNAYIYEVATVLGYHGAEIRSYDPETNTFIMFLPFPFDIAVGDTVIVTQGCDKTLATCKDRYDNVPNYRGEPYIPGSRATQECADQGSSEESTAEGATE